MPTSYALGVELRSDMEKIVFEELLRGSQKVGLKNIY